VVGDLVTKTPCNYVSTVKGSKVCPVFSVNALWQFMDDYDYLWGGMLLGAGVFLAFCGRKLFVAAIFMITSIAVVFGILLLFYSTFLKNTTEAWVGWLVLSLSIVVGIFAGYFMTKLQRVGAAVLAGWGGFMLGLFLNETVIYLSGSIAVFWIVNFGCAGVLAILAFFSYNHAIILSTSFIGAYFMWRGVSLYAGGFPNEFTLIN